MSILHQVLSRICAAVSVFTFCNLSYCTFTAFWIHLAGWPPTCKTCKSQGIWNWRGASQQKWESHVVCYRV